MAFDIEKGYQGYKFSKLGFTEKSKKSDLKYCAKLVEREFENNVAELNGELEIVKCMESKNWQALQFVVNKH